MAKVELILTALTPDRFGPLAAADLGDARAGGRGVRQCQPGAGRALGRTAPDGQARAWRRSRGARGRVGAPPPRASSRNRTSTGPPRAGSGGAASAGAAP